MSVTGERVRVPAVVGRVGGGWVLLLLLVMREVMMGCRWLWLLLWVVMRVLRVLGVRVVGPGVARALGVRWTLVEEGAVLVVPVEKNFSALLISRTHVCSSAKICPRGYIACAAGILAEYSAPEPIGTRASRPSLCTRFWF